jgi:hypothetical protein
MAEHEARGGLEDSNAVDVIWRLSGLPALGRAISERIIEGEGRDMIAHAPARRATSPTAWSPPVRWPPSVSQAPRCARSNARS